MDWRDVGALLAVRTHGETSAIIEVFTADHGRHAGVVRGGASRKTAPLLQPGAQLDLTWRARLEDHIGTFTVEPVRSRAALLSDRLALAGLNAICALLHFTLPEREPHPDLYARSIALLDTLGAAPGWPLDYLQWELMLLEELGYGLDLTGCAVSGSREDLAYVSPKTGRAVSRDAAGDWANRLLPLPPCLLGQGPASGSEIADGLRTTGYFLEHRLAYDLRGRGLPEARRRLVDMLARQG
ncbi:DNA repair protein RecO [Defluviimonas aquaemixtae]|uniref:DNA repair protein RecO n=1 Tax=Albidovulum aquaemixtae TaxID=1542388 RepID=A0A2R8B1X5_9RHOB|nr:DNA repair protein RecO [Defluviimonas aquaemixtae]SPH16598.1 DNA repair protein RecO [Defluviimonas aquaemixtae]